MSSKMKRRRQAQRLQQELAESRQYNKSFRDAARTARRDLEISKNRNDELKLIIGNKEDFFLRELARYKFIDEMIARVADTLGIEEKIHYLSGTHIAVSESIGFPHQPFEMLCMSPPPFNPKGYGELDMTESQNANAAMRNMACEKILLRVLSAEAYSEDDSRLSNTTDYIRLIFDGHKYYTCMVSGLIAKLPEDIALSVLRRELTPAFYRAIKNMSE